MAKIKVNVKDSQTFVKSKLDKKERINERELGILQNKLIRGFMRPSVEKEKKIKYVAPLCIPLNKYLQTGLSKMEFYLIFAQIIETVKRIERNSLNINNLVMNPKYVFVNEKTKELFFVYQPLTTESISTNMFSFIYDVIYHTNLNLDEDHKFLNALKDFLSGLESFSTDEIEKYVLKTYPDVYKKIRREKPGQSQVLNEKKRYYDDADDDTGLLDEDDTGLLNEDDTGLLVEENDDTGLLVEDEDDTGLLIEDEDDTGLLVEDDPETSLLSESAATKVNPYIIRLSNGEQVRIHKPAFRVGKEKSYVDYFVTNNSAVSRIHADIITRNDRFFIVDNNSTNGTYINGLILEEKKETEIFDGDELKLANEKFEFHTM